MKKFFIALSVFLVPASLYAQSFNQLDSLTNKVIEYAGKAVGFLMILATLYFIWLVIGLMTEKDPKNRDEKKKQLTWAVIGLAIMVCVWGLIKFAANTLGISTNQSGVQVPCPLGTTYHPAGGGQPGGCW